MPMKRQELTREKVRALIERADGRCERCLISVLEVEAYDLSGRGTMWSVQHRKPAGAGGTNDPAFNSPANLLLLCGHGTVGCHGQVEHYRTQAREDGFLVWQSQDPESIAVRIGVASGRPWRAAYLGPGWSYSWRDTAGAV